jgi:glycosyltransferase involved in cell wall biosynthesis
MPFIAAARAADRVLVTTHFTEQDALNYAGVEKGKVRRVPILAPHGTTGTERCSGGSGSYFLWTTNLAYHKNHYNALYALREYYESLDGQLDCRVSGVRTESLLDNQFPHLEPLKTLFSQSDSLQRRLRLLGELPDAWYWTELAGARFLWHPARIDNGTLAVVEAAAMGVPSLSSRYPPMEEIDTHFDLQLTWMDAGQPRDMARQLKWMETHAGEARSRLPARETLTRRGVDGVASEYWKVIRECI